MCVRQHFVGCLCPPCGTTSSCGHTHSCLGCLLSVILAGPGLAHTSRAPQRATLHPSPSRSRERGEQGRAYGRRATSPRRAAPATERWQRLGRAGDGWARRSYKTEGGRIARPPPSVMKVSGTVIGRVGRAHPRQGGSSGFGSQRSKRGRSVNPTGLTAPSPARSNLREVQVSQRRTNPH